MHIFFFRNDCNPKEEFYRFCDYYSKNNWTYSGGEKLDTIEAKKKAAEKWKVRSSVETPYPNTFMKAWKEVYMTAPPELQEDIIRIGYITKQQFTSITISCSKRLKEWMYMPDKHQMIVNIFRKHAGEKYQFKYVQFSSGIV